MIVDLTANRIEGTVSVGTGLVFRGDLDIDVRKEFVAQTTTALASADGAGDQVELFCSSVDRRGPVDDTAIEILVTLARTAQRRGARLVLVHAPRPMRAQLTAAGVAHFFDFRR